MAEINHKQKETKISERPNNFLRLLYALLFLFAISIAIWRIFFYKSPREQLAAIETRLAIPSSENAAIIYNQLFENYTDSDLRPAFLTPAIEEITRSSIWRNQDYPEVAKWLEENNEIFIKLLQASEYDKCLFSITVSSSNDMDNKMARLSLVRQYAFWLIRSANNDFGEGRTDLAMKKYISCIHMGRHFHQQPIAIEFLVGIGAESVGLQKVRFFIMNKNTTEEQIKTLETVLPDTEFHFDKYWNEMLQVENLYSKILPQTTLELSNFVSQLKEMFANLGKPDPALVRVKELYLRLLTDRYGTQILAALRHYKNENGKWPEKLEEIKPYLSSKDILIDPQNKGSFIYKLKNDSIMLYSTGLNGIDENGQIKAPADDWQIWPLQTSQVQTATSDPNQ